MSALEAREARLLAGVNASEEGTVRPVQSLNHILQNLGTDLFVLRA